MSSLYNADGVYLQCDECGLTIPELPEPPDIDDPWAEEIQNEKQTTMIRPTVYVSGPYTTGDQAANVAKAIDAAEILWNKGYAPVVPHLSILWQMQHPHSWGEWIALDLAILAKCKYIYRVPGESKGADQEIAFAREHGIKEVKDE